MSLENISQLQIGLQFIVDMPSHTKIICLSYSLVCAHLSVTPGSSLELSESKVKQIY